MDPLHVAELCRLLVVIVLVASALAKSANMAAFAASLESDFAVPAALGRPGAIAIAAAEWAAAMAMLSGGDWARFGAGLALVLLVVFTAAVAQVVVMKRRVACQCFGQSGHTLSWLDLARNTIYLVAVAVFLLWGGTTPVPGGLMAQLLMGLAAGVCFLVSISLHDVRNLVR